MIGGRKYQGVEPYFGRFFLTLSWRRPISYRNQSIDLLLCKSMDLFLYGIGFRHERVKQCKHIDSFSGKQLLYHCYTKWTINGLKNVHGLYDCIVSLRIKSECERMSIRKTPNTDNFCVVCSFTINLQQWKIYTGIYTICTEFTAK